ncbi:MAG TPA: glycosyltransferase family 4 protein [Dehalococcoidia bacterium]|nr:glycosyltransferase family 4 protein [Dehalococcoidia bacterium]
MRVALVTYDFDETGGQGRFSQGLVRALRRCDVEVDVISPGSADWRWPSRLATRLGKNAGFSLAANWELPALLRQGGYDLVHANGGPGGVFLPLGLKPPLVYTAHHTYSQQSRLVGGQGWKATLASAEKRSYQHAEAIAAVTQSTADSVVRESGIPPHKVRVIPNGLDFESFQPSGHEKQPRTCLFVGRLDARKGFTHLIHAWSRVVEQRPDARLLVIGGGPERAACERFLAERGIENSVQFLGRVDHTDLIRHYSEAQCVAVPSVFEGFGLAALEAFACGTRVLARDVEGLRDVVSRPELGTLVAFDDVEAYADAILDEFERPRAVDPSMRAALIAQYDWQVVVQDYLALYEATLGRTAVASIAA